MDILLTYFSSVIAIYINSLSAENLLLAAEINTKTYRWSTQREQEYAVLRSRQTKPQHRGDVIMKSQPTPAEKVWADKESVFPQGCGTTVF